MSSLSRSRARIALTGIAAAFALTLTGLGCDDAPEGTRLTAPGQGIGSGTISGRLTFDGMGGPGLPAAEVWILSTFDAAHVTNWQSLHFTGSYNGWDTGVWDGEGMRYLGGGIWSQFQDLPAGDLAWKFVTNGGWDNDYSNPGGVDGLSGECVLGSGGGNDLTATIPLDASYWLMLDEGGPSYAVVAADLAPTTLSNRDTGDFSITNLPSGMYTVVVIADGFLDRVFPDIDLGEDENIALGTLNVPSAAFGAIAGMVTFSDTPDPFPTASIRVFDDGTGITAATGATDATGAYAIAEVPLGTWSIEASATGYLTATLAGVVVTEGTTTTATPLALEADLMCEASTAIEAVGEFNNWPPPGAGPHATLIDPTSCVWADTLAIDISADPDSTYFMKLRTNDAWDDDDWGSCTGEGTVHLFEGNVLSEAMCIVGSSDAFAVKFPASGEYEMQLNERTGQVTWRLLAP